MGNTTTRTTQDWHCLQEGDQNRACGLSLCLCKMKCNPKCMGNLDKTAETHSMYRDKMREPQ